MGATNVGAGEARVFTELLKEWEVSRSCIEASVQAGYEDAIAQGSAQLSAPGLRFEKGSGI